jgi:hypothetical protein
LTGDDSNREEGQEKHERTAAREIQHAHIVAEKTAADAVATDAA